MINSEIIWEHEEVSTYNSDDDAQCQDAGVLPPHLSPDIPRATPKRRCLVRHVVGPIYEQLNSLATTEDLLHILNHDVLHLGQLVLGIGELIGGWVGVVGMHEFWDDRRKRPLETVRRTVGKSGRSGLRSELNGLGSM
jgi:hypothetical protein